MSWYAVVLLCWCWCETVSISGCRWDQSRHGRTQRETCLQPGVCLCLNVCIYQFTYMHTGSSQFVARTHVAVLPCHTQAIDKCDWHYFWIWSLISISLLVLLLIDLEYNDKVRVLCVFNGPEMVANDKWNLQTMIDTQRRLSMASWCVCMYVCNHDCCLVKSIVFSQNKTTNQTQKNHIHTNKQYFTERKQRTHCAYWLDDLIKDRSEIMWF